MRAVEIARAVETETEITPEKPQIEALATSSREVQAEAEMTSAVEAEASEEMIEVVAELAEEVITPRTNNRVARRIETRVLTGVSILREGDRQGLHRQMVQT